MTRRGLLVAATATVGAIGAGAYGGIATPSSSIRPAADRRALAGRTSGPELIGLLLDTDFRTVAGGIFLGYVRFARTKKTAFSRRLYKNSGGGPGARLCIDVTSLLMPEGD